MNIAMVSEHASPLAVLGGVDAGGQNVHVAALATAISRLGADVTVYTRRDERRLPKRVDFVSGVTVEHVDAGPPHVLPKDELYEHMPAFAEQLSRAWTDSRPDIVHAHFWMSGIASCAAAEALPLPLVQTFHALGIERRRHQGAKDSSPPERLQEERRIVETVDRVVATATAEAFELARMGADSSRISVIPCGVDLTRFTPDGPCEVRAPGFFRLVCVTRLVERKGVGTVIEALARLRNVELVVAGGPSLEALPSDPEYARLMKLAREQGVADRVHFRGRLTRDQVPALMRSADAVVCVPWYEPFGMVALEAMACGTPVIASSVGGLIDTVLDGKVGLHVPARDAGALVKAVRLLMQQPELSRQFAAAGRRRAEQRYGWDRIAKQTMDVYREVIFDRTARDGRSKRRSHFHGQS
ncbi:MAG TPA: glycosyltransferase [Candidatus Acidoferrales bacterium]|nr:glycosyltransferase [Candidatus Acidoferrales bacterium]